MSLARRCDAAHRQMEQVRQGIARVERLPDDSPEWREQLYETLGDAELAMVALHRAVDMAARLRERLHTTAPCPAEVESKRAAVKSLRDAYEHIDERALGLVKKKSDPEAHTGMTGGAFASLFSDRTVIYAGYSFNISQEATDLLMVLRRYIISVWVELTGPDRPLALPSTC